MSKNHTFWSSSIGLKILMALSGIILIGFIVGHLVGNLQMFLGADAVNAYAVFLKSTGALLWVARAGILLAFVVHIYTSLKLDRLNAQARPESYKCQTSVQATLASRTMIVSGILVVAFVVYHLLHLTFWVTHPEHTHFADAQGRHDVYKMVVLGFQQVPIAFMYLIFLAALAVHLSHAIGSFFQSLGICNPKHFSALNIVRYLVAAVVFIGYASIPLAVQIGIITT